MAPEMLFLRIFQRAIILPLLNDLQEGRGAERAIWECCRR